MQSLVDAMNFIDANSYGQGALNYSTGTLPPCLPFFPLTPVNLTSSPSPLTNYAILFKSHFLRHSAKLSYHSVPGTHFVSVVVSKICIIMSNKPFNSIQIHETHPKQWREQILWIPYHYHLNLSFSIWGLCQKSTCNLLRFSWKWSQKHLTWLSLLFPAVLVWKAHKELY